MMNEREFTNESLLKQDQSIKADAGKPRLSLVPARKTMDAVARIREYGCKKYNNPDNWKKVDVQRYKDALMRHWFKYLEDPNSVDEESGLPHLHHAACNMFFIIELEGNENDKGN